MCRKSGTVPLNSPRLLIRHWIPSTGLHTDIHTKRKEESISRPTQTDYAVQTTKYYQIKDNTTSTGNASQEDSNDRPLLSPEDINQPNSSETYP
jgi:hypothetical protein